MPRTSKPKPHRDSLPRRNVVISEGIIRPTGLVDPKIYIKPVASQVDDVLHQVNQRIAHGQRVLITTLTKKFAQELDLYFKQLSIKSAYIHSDVDTLERLDILKDLRRGKYDVLIGINLLREGLDLPEVSLVAIFDADKEGFLRSQTSLIQIIGRAARHVDGTVIMYADSITDSMKRAIDETNRRREIQLAYNAAHHIIPQSTTRKDETISDTVRQNKQERSDEYEGGSSSPSTLSLEADNYHAQDFTIDSRFSHSVHGQKRKAARLSKSEQLYASFDQAKQQAMNTLKDLSDSELLVQLEIAIDSLHFEEAAAIRDILALRKNTKK